MTALTDTPLDPATIRRAVDDCLEHFLERKARTATVQRMPDEIVDTLRGFLFAGGKRLRPLLCAIGWEAGGDAGTAAAMVKTAASLELFHAYALIHDDVMDRSDTRRGRPTVHRALASRHRPARGRKGAERLGTGGAILIGDLALSWSDELLHTAGLPPNRLLAVLPLIDVMRTEVVCGQYLDLLATGRHDDGIETPLRIIRYKTAKYTVERPLLIGATLAGASSTAMEDLSAYAIPLGEAFQLRDDLLGVFGDPQKTGKSRLDDLREGKHTVLLAIAWENADSAQRSLLQALLGRADLSEQDAAKIRHILIVTGARAKTEHMIRVRTAQARHALSRSRLPTTARHTLHTITEAATVRST
ncbi:polyprenyl synthetase family protein [Streptomyces sp. NPDC021100]|uniref:polyprenyl synthetase family protein n=1 Tax=Streptomyces sp. NPDC021100 TaxID=3365114 RepID=UPI003792E83C